MVSIFSIDIGFDVFFNSRIGGCEPR